MTQLHTSSNIWINRNEIQLNKYYHIIYPTSSLTDIPTSKLPFNSTSNIFKHLNQQKIYPIIESNRMKSYFVFNWHTYFEIAPFNSISNIFKRRRALFDWIASREIALVETSLSLSLALSLSLSLSLSLATINWIFQPRRRVEESRNDNSGKWVIWKLVLSEFSFSRARG